MSFKAISLLSILSLQIACSAGSVINPSKSELIEFDHPVFGKIELEYDPHSDSEVQYEVFDQPIGVTFFLKNKNIPRAEELLDRVAVYITEMKQFEQLALNEIKRNLSQTEDLSSVDDHAVKWYRDHVLETFSEAELHMVFAIKDRKSISDETFLSHLRFFDIVLSPDNETESARFYFTVSSAITYHRLVVVFDVYGKIIKLNRVS